MKLWIDDNRPKPSFDYDTQAWTVEAAISLLKRAKEAGEKFELVSFDYDAHAFQGWTFEAVAEWIRDNDYWPDEIRIHTYNWWIGRVWYEQFFAEHAPESTVVDLSNPWDFMDEVGLAKLHEAPEWVQKFALEVKVVSK